MSDWISVEVPPLKDLGHVYHMRVVRAKLASGEEVKARYILRRGMSPMWTFDSGGELHGVTHWMPLPEPPKE